MEVRLSQQIDIAQNYTGQGDSNSASAQDQKEYVRLCRRSQP